MTKICIFSEYFGESSWKFRRNSTKLYQKGFFRRDFQKFLVWNPKICKSTKRKVPWLPIISYKFSARKQIMKMKKLCESGMYRSLIVPKLSNKN